MSTAARCNGLMIRVKPLEAEFPSIEKAFLSQTSHSHFSYNAGFDWHANLRVDENLITRGRLPLVIMDSYEECRGPPQLFVLDKFDIAGAGACLKRYSYPSFYKTEFASGKMKSECQREKKSRKIKKKGLRWKNGESPEFSASDFSSKLNHVASDEHTEKIPTHGVRLKRRNFNGSTFNSRTGRIYMEHILKMHSPEHNVSCENSVDPTRSKLNSNDTSESTHEMCEVGIVGSAIKWKRDGTRVPFPNREEVLIPSDEFEEDMIEIGMLKSMPEPTCEFEAKKVPSMFDPVDQKDALVDSESKTDDDNASELENYMDAFTTMESELETGYESRVKHDSDTNDEQLELGGRHSESRSAENSSASSDWNNSFKNGRSCGANSETLSNFAYLPPSHGNEIASLDTPMTFDDSLKSEYVGPCLAYEKPQSGTAENLLSKISQDAIYDVSFGKFLRNSDILGTKSSEELLPNGNSNEVSEITSYACELGEASCGSCIADSTSTLSHLSPSVSLGEVQLSRPNQTKIWINGKLDLSNSEALPREEQPNSPIKQERDNCPDSTSSLICLPVIPPHTESQHFCDAKSHIAASSEIATDWETLLSNNLGSLSNASESDMKNIHVPEGIYVNPFHTVGNNVDLDTASSAEIHMQSDDLETRSIPVEADSNGFCLDLISSQKASNVEDLVDCLSSETGLDWHKMETMGPSNVKELIGSDVQRIPTIVVSENKEDPVFIPTGLKLESYNPNSLDSDYSRTEFLNCLMPIEGIQIHMHSSNGSQGPITSRESDQGSESKFPHQSHPSRSMKDAMYAYMINGLNISSRERFHSDQGAGNDMINGLNISSQTKSGCVVSELEACIPSVLNFESSELATSSSDSYISAITSSPIFTSFNLLIPDMTHNQLFEFSLPDPNALQTNVEMPPLPPLPPLEWRVGKFSHGLLNLDGAMSKPANSLAPLPGLKDEKPQHRALTFEGEMVYPLSSFAQKPDMEDQKPQQGLRPRDPLIEAVASHDKSKLRKVSERIGPVMRPNIDESDSLLEQIRTKSFNLKPAVVTKPIIHGPKTNLNVAAVLEKANTIRQAFVGSDEDDGDSWSDC
ncbi:uncharacterized protein LOC143850002 isoform X2 [Tasmannia lanceolata]